MQGRSAGNHSLLQKSGNINSEIEETEMTMENVCYFNKFGFCKFLQKCRFRHVDKLCEEENCEIKSCSSRHPKACRYFSEFKMCKFGEYCRFAHKVSADDSQCGMEDIVEKVETIKKVCEH